MENTILTAPQRKVLADMLKVNHWDDCLWKIAKKKYDAVRNKRKSALIRESSKTVKDLLEQLQTVQQQIDQLEQGKIEASLALSKRGFTVDDDGDVDVEISSPLYKSLKKRLDDELGTIDDVVNLPFERARIKLWTVATPEEAERILEPFLNFEVKTK